MTECTRHRQRPLYTNIVLFPFLSLFTDRHRNVAQYTVDSSSDSCFTMTDPFDADVLKDLRGLGKPVFDGNDSDYQDIRFSFRIHMSFVSAFSHTLMDKCEVERNPINLAGVKALGEANLKCCIQMYYPLALITKGSARTLDRSVEESNGAEAWRPIHSRYAPDTQNRQFALMCDHAEGLGSGLRAWELDVGEWEHTSGTVLAVCSQVQSDEDKARYFSGTICSWVHIANFAALRTALLPWCYSSRDSGASPDCVS